MVVGIKVMMVAMAMIMFVRMIMLMIAIIENYYDYDNGCGRKLVKNFGLN